MSNGLPVPVGIDLTAGDIGNGYVLRSVYLLSSKDRELFLKCFQRQDLCLVGENSP